MKILVVDDEKQIRSLLSEILMNAGHEITTAENGVQAWNILRESDIRVVITDWMMPEMDGLALCKKIRSEKLSRYIFIILLTAKGATNDLIEGLDAGADEFLFKPTTKAELNARIRACERILDLEKDLEDRNRKLNESNQKLNQAYSIIRDDLEAAGQIQLNLLPKADTLYGVQFDWLFIPSKFVAGDTFGYFKLDEHHLGFYLIDVAGNGIPAALLSVSLSNMMTPGFHVESILKRRIDTYPRYQITPPADVLSELNQRFQLHDDTGQYFTMIYGIIDTRSGRVVITQAGHPSPIHISSNNNTTNLIGDGGYPVGMFPDLVYEETEFFLEKGDRLALYSDGITECINNNKEQFSLDRLVDLLKRERSFPCKHLMKQVQQDLKAWHGNTEFKDDVTLLNICF